MHWSSIACEFQELKADLPHFLKNEMSPRQTFHNFDTSLLSITLVGKQPSKILHLLLVVLYHDLLEALKKEPVIIRKVPFVEDLLKKLIVHRFFLRNFPKLAKEVLEISIFTFWKWEFLRFLVGESMLIFGQLKDELERLTHAILYQFFLGLLNLHKLFHEDLDHRTTWVERELFLEGSAQVIQRQIWKLNQIIDDLSA